MLAKWMGYIETHATADVSMMILGSKADLEDMREIQYDEGRKVINKLYFYLDVLSISVC